ncbi:hypothetical protein [Butyrivibrio fibrisolvens]|uniref:hypothetical protein n=1 Tax=Butyrivibrio fibrisolvens TaxID=831 RepID=UPI00040E21C3|nr:hypothetical protein [Butyrivibrio fibrisolvens]
MNHVIAKIKGKEKTYEKLFSGDSIFELPSDLDNAVEYNPEIILEEYEWYKIENFSVTPYVIDLLRHNFNTTDYGEAKKVKKEKIEYIVSVQDDIFFFQRIFKHNILVEKLISIGDVVRLDQGNKYLVVNPLPDAVYLKRDDVLYFRKLSTISPIFKGIDELYREATEEEIDRFLQNDFIELKDCYGVENIKKSNRKRIAMAMEALDSFSKKDKQKILKYTHEYYPTLTYDEKNKVFTIGSEEEMKHLLWGIEQRYYTTPVTNEKRVANSVIQLP